MSGDEYLRSVFGRIRRPVGPRGPGDRVRTGLVPALTAWATTQLVAVTVSGSYAKGTAIIGGSDVDLFISLKADTTQNLREIYNNLAEFMKAQGFVVRKQNVSINVQYSSYSVDLVAGKQQTTWSTDYSIYVSRRDTWTKTNVSTHINYVVNSARVQEICLLKHWRRLHNLEFPSFALELAVVKGLTGRYEGRLANNVFAAFAYLRDNATTMALPDPANASNNVASDLTQAERQAIAGAARVSTGKQTWGEIIW
jgi:tRNA nucleotidyltransferase (CCA-adding enzyme)